jgi:UPF0755 protein
MSDWEQRSAEEREAARLERERRRSERPSEPTPVSAPESDRPPVPAVAPEPEAVSPDDDEPPIFDEEQEHDGEAPLGIKTVARSQRLNAEKQQPRRRPGKPRRRITRVGGRVMAVLAIVVVAVVLWFLYELFQPFHGSGHSRVTVTIPQHSSVSSVASLLESKGVISSAFFFQLRATIDGERSDLRSGTYHFKLDMNYTDVLKELTTAPRAAPTTMLTLVDGKSRQQIDALLRSQHIRGSYIAETRHSRLLGPVHYGAPRSTPDLEGFLFPSTYQVRTPVNISALVADQLKTFKQQFARVNVSYARSRHLTPYNVLTIASIIEDEAAARHDYPLVASVIYNRLKDHMPLGMDSTTRYEFNDWTHPLTTSQLAAHSPYNTRLRPGLPPTPIGNPGMAAINAAAHPTRTNYLYFVAGVCGNGSSVFSSSYQQFLRDSARYQNARARRGGSPVHC